MKTRVCIIPLLLVVLSCSRDETGQNGEFKEYNGIWVPYIIIHPDGTSENGPFTANNFFGAYDESVELIESTEKYIPVS